MASRGIGIDIEEAEQAAKASMAEWYFGGRVFSKTCVRQPTRCVFGRRNMPGLNKSVCDACVCDYDETRAWFLGLHIVQSTIT